jgi:hypothetical protein
VDVDLPGSQPLIPIGLVVQLRWLLEADKQTTATNPQCAILDLMGDGHHLGVLCGGEGCLLEMLEDLVVVGVVDTDPGFPEPSAGQ